MAATADLYKSYEAVFNANGTHTVVNTAAAPAQWASIDWSKVQLPPVQLPTQQSVPVAPTGPVIRGVGVVFDDQAVGSGHKIFVRSVQSGSSADSSQIAIGDVLIRVNGLDVYGQPLAAVRHLIPGPAGTAVKLTFKKSNGRFYEVSLVRNSKKLGPKKCGAAAHPWFGFLPFTNAEGQKDHFVVDHQYASYFPGVTAAAGAASGDDLKGTQV